jgi:Haem-NO-binding
MYGLINRAVEGLIKKQFGDDKWEEIKSKSGFDDEGFIGMKSYPDQFTYKLIETASDVLKISSTEILESFGEHWVLYTSEEGYGSMMKAGGNTLPEFLKNLNMMHFRLGNIMPEMKMPEFEVTDEQTNCLHLHYRSTRMGLAPMVIGLTKGLGKRFNISCDVKQIAFKLDDNTHDIFEVKW